MQLQRRANHNHRTAGIIDALAEQVLTETSALPFDHISERFQWTLICAGHCLAAAAIIKQRIDRFLKHPFFVAHDISGAFNSRRRFKRLFRLITRRYKSFKSEVAKRPPSSGTSGLKLGGSTGSTSRIIHVGLMPER